MSSQVLPQPNLPPESVQWSRKSDQVTRGNARDLERLNLNLEMSNRATAGQMGVIGRQLEAISEQQTALAAQQGEIFSLLERLQDAGRVETDQTATATQGDSWMANPPSVQMSSLSGRFRVSVIGTAAGATTFYSFSAPGYPRDRILGTSATAVTSRVSASGGVSALNTVYGSWVVSLAPGELHTFTAQARGTGEYSATQGLGIQVESLI